MIDFKVLVITVRLVLCVVAVTTLAAIVNKYYLKRMEASRTRFLAALHEQFGRLADPATRPEALRWIAAGFLGRWSLIAAQQVNELDPERRAEITQALEDRAIVDRFLRDTRHRLKWTRAHALRVLGELKLPAAVPVVLAALDDKDSDVRNVAARALGSMKLEASDEALVGLLGRHEQAVSARIAAMCIEMGTRTGPLLIGTLRGGTPKARFWAARILGEIRETRAVTQLLETLHDAEADVRSASAWALGSIGEPSATAGLEEALADPIWYVRAHAAEAIGKIGDPAMATALGDALGDRSWWVRKNALDALVKLGDAARPALTRALESGDRFARDSAIEALTVMGVAVTVPRTGTAA
jgi:HEAT repeat protein